MAADGLLDRADWELRSPELGALVTSNHTVLMEFEPAEHVWPSDWVWLRHLWLCKLEYPHILEAVDRGGGSKVLLRYAAIQWKRPTLRLGGTHLARQLVATWGAQLARAYRHVIERVPANDVVHFLRPLVLIDLVNDVRLAFLPVDRDGAQLPPELNASWPRCDERAIVYLIGATLVELCEDWEAAEALPIRSILLRCIEADPSSRFQTLAELEAAWAPLALSELTGSRREAWTRAQEGVGWLAVNRVRTAWAAFLTATRLNPRLRVAKEGHDRTVELLGPVHVAHLELPPSTRAIWSDVADKGARLEADHQYIEALALYARAQSDPARDLAIARCQLAVRAWGPAIDYAERVLAVEAANTTAHSIRTRATLLPRRYVEALQFADAWLHIDRDDGEAHYARGRALLALGRFVDARDAFDRAFALRPQMLEAMLLRREADRLVRRTTKDAGTSRPMSLDVPDHLLAIKEPLEAGRLDDVLAILERAEYADDAVARLAHAECLAFDQRFDEALAMFERAAQLSPEQRPKAVLGKVRALLALERAADAIAELDRLGAVTDVDVVELRGLALQRIGLPTDAEHELGRVVAASASRSDLRIGKR